MNNGGFLLTVGGTGNSTYGGVISGGGGLTKTDAGTVTLSGLNTYGGTTTISGGTLLAGVNNALSSASDVVLANTAGALLDLNNTTQTIKSLSGGGATGGNVAIGSGSLTINGTGITTFSGLFTGSGALSVTNAGKLTLRGDSTWTGPLNVSGGAVVSIDSAARLGPSGTANGQITLDNGTIEQTNPGTNGTFTPALRNITLGAGGGTLSYTTPAHRASSKPGP